MQALLDAIAQFEMPTDASRIFHGRGGRYPGCEHLVLDAFPPVLVLTSFQPLEEAALAAVGEALQARWAHIGGNQPLNWVYQMRQPGAKAETRLMAGCVPEPHTVTEACNTAPMCCAGRTTAFFWTWPKAGAGCVNM